ncbi:MAG: septum formation initiator family protein [Bacteroidetes bacterium]|nr:septum formation initiator family protein [Bacteroidota bacterium]
MGWKTFIQNKYVRFFTNKYLVVFVLFVLWMVFLDTNSYLIHRELDQEIEQLEKKRDFFSGEIQSDRDAIENLKDAEKLEEFAREKYYMKRDNEDVYIIEYDSTAHE